MNICPQCSSKNIYYSKKHKQYFCEDCDSGFVSPKISCGTKIFISYAHDSNQKIVNMVKDYVQGRGYDVGIDTSEIPPGTDGRERITRGLLGSNIVISFLSKKSVRDPGVCLDEIKFALCMKHLYIIFILLENENDVKPPQIIESQGLDMSTWQKVSDIKGDSYFEIKMTKLLDVLLSDDVVKFTKEIELLKKKLNYRENYSKEHNLLKKNFLGRRGLAESVQTFLDKSKENRMMIYSVPGAGKSAFSVNFAHYNPNVISLLMLDYDETKFMSVDDIIKQLAFKLAESLPDYRNILCNMLQDKEETKDFFDYCHNSMLYDRLILSPLSCCINGNRENKLIIIDGMDEIDSDISTLLFKKSELYPLWIKTLFTSRYEETQLGVYAGIDNIVIGKNCKENKLDIKKYLTFELNKKYGNSIIHKLSTKCEGSFIYAEILCSCIKDNSISLNDINTIPPGIYRLYYELFNRLFTQFDKYTKVKPFLEILSTEGEIPIEVFCECLNADKYDLGITRSSLKSIVISNNGTYQFVHKTIADGLSNINLSGRYYIDNCKGYELLCKTASKYGFLDQNSYSDFIDKWKPRKKEIFLNANFVISFSDKRDFYIQMYPYWLIKSNQYDEYKQLLLRSHTESNYVGDNLYEWRFLPFVPTNYIDQDIESRFVEVFKIHEYGPGNLALERLRRVAFIFSYINTDCRFINQFYYFLRQPNFKKYFNYEISNFEIHHGYNGQTFRDSNEEPATLIRIRNVKKDLVAYINTSLKMLEFYDIDVPIDIKLLCEGTKVYFRYLNGTFEMDLRFIFYNIPGFSTHGNILFKDVCIYEDLADNTTNKEIEQIINYNTTHLGLYLISTDEIDANYVDNAIIHRADIISACDNAIGYLRHLNTKVADENGRWHYPHQSGPRPNNIESRIKYIKSLLH